MEESKKKNQTKLKITRRTFLKISSIILTAIIGKLMILKLLNDKIKFAIGDQINNNFTTTIIHSLSDSDNGKSFVISNFPTNCIINEIKIRSNYTVDNERIWTVFVDNDTGIIPSDTIIPYRGIWDSPVIGEYLFIDNEIVLIVSDEGSNLIVKRGVKGTTPVYHNNNTPIRIKSNGLRLILFKNSNVKLSEKLKIFKNLMTWQGTVNSIVVLKDRYIKFSDSIQNIEKDDVLYLDDGLYSEITSVEDINNKVDNNSFENTIFVAEPLMPHITGIDVQKLIVFDELISYKGDNNLYGILYVDGNIDKNKYPDGIIVYLEISTF